MIYVALGSYREDWWPIEAVHNRWRGGWWLVNVRRSRLSIATTTTGSCAASHKSRHPVLGAQWILQVWQIGSQYWPGKTSWRQWMQQKIWLAWLQDLNISILANCVAIWALTEVRRRRGWWAPIKRRSGYQRRTREDLIEKEWKKEESCVRKEQEEWRVKEREFEERSTLIIANHGENLDIYHCIHHILSSNSARNLFVIPHCWLRTNWYIGVVRDKYCLPQAHWWLMLFYFMVSINTKEIPETYGCSGHPRS